MRKRATPTAMISVENAVKFQGICANLVTISVQLSLFALSGSPSEIERYEIQKNKILKSMSVQNQVAQNLDYVAVTGDWH